MIFVRDSQLMHVTVEQIIDIDAGKSETLKTHTVYLVFARKKENG